MILNEMKSVYTLFQKSDPYPKKILATPNYEHVIIGPYSRGLL